MEDKYLWDRSGEPDPEIQELEEILGRLRYQPRPLEIPPNFQIHRRQSFFPAMAIAAAIGLFAIVLGLWFGFNRRQAPAVEAKHDKQIEQRNSPPQPEVRPDNAPSQTAVVEKPQPKVVQEREAPRSLSAGNRRTVIRQPELTAHQLAEKEQVLVALRLVSAKLNLAQRKTQGAPQPNTIRNQHKMG